MKEQPPNWLPMPWWMSPVHNGQAPTAQAPIHDETPARVRIALQFLQDLSLKTMCRAAINDMSIDIIDGQKLTGMEAEAQRSACVLLRDYFAGTLPHSEIEALQLDQAKGLLGRNGEAGGGTILKCIACLPGPVKADCTLCGGTGQLLVFPTSGS